MIFIVGSTSKKIAGVIYFFILFATLLFFQNCDKTHASRETQFNPGFSKYIAGYTGGVISTVSPVTVQLTQPTQVEVKPGDDAGSGIFTFFPDIKGRAIWVDNRTLEFKPDRRLKQDEKYEIRFNLGQLMEVPEKFEIFTFIVRTMPQDFEVNFEGIFTENPRDLSTQLVKGIILTADVADAKFVEDMLKCSQEGHILPVKWTHSDEGKRHDFTIKEIIRGEKSSLVTVQWDGGPLGIKRQGKKEINIPSLGDFIITDTRVYQYPDQYVSIFFSDPVKKDQYLNGLITLDNNSDLDFTVNGNEIKVFPTVKQVGTHILRVNKGIQNVLGYRFIEEEDFNLEFEQAKPAVRVVKTGVILPTSQGLIFPFEAVNMKAIDLEVIRIYEDNIPQFLQVNDLNGNRELRRVGYPVLHKIIPLLTSGVIDPGKWNRYTLDLAELFKAEPGALYQLRINIRKEHSLYYCGEEIDYKVMEKVIDDAQAWDNYETNYWDYYEDNNYPQGFIWRERDNPCHVSYFNSDRSITHNLLVSDLGIIAKLGGDGNLKVFVNDLKTTKAIPDVTLQFYDFQQQVIGEIRTDENGSAEIPLKSKPYLLIASKDNQKGYLKLNDGNALSLSNFDISGQAVQTGLKGYIYCERGVWRPGDSLHVAFIKEDKSRIIPESHPVTFELYNPLGQLTGQWTKTSSIGGIYIFNINTDQDAPTGNWTGKITIGGATFSKRLKIESIKPNRLKIDLDFGVEHLTVSDKSISGDLNVRWLHGAVAQNLKAEFEMSLSQADTRFDEFPDYEFDDPTRRFDGENYQIFDGYIDEKGHAVIHAKIDMKNEAPGMLIANFKGKVFEESGNFSVDRFTIPYYPFSSFVGIRVPEGDAASGMLLTDTTHIIRIVTIDADGNSIDRNNLEMEVYKLNWRWWWESRGEDLGNYVGSTYHKPLIRKMLYTRDGKGAATLKINYPEWGRYLIRICDPLSGHCTGKIIYFDWPGWAGRAAKDIPGGATMLNFSSDKERYHVGESIILNIPGSGIGRALISVEDGTGVLESHWLNTVKGDNKFLLDCKSDFSPNIYVHVTLIQPHAQTVNDLPVRMYGIINVFVDDPETHLLPVISMADELKPNQQAEITISEKSGKPMAYTIAIVDEGLLDLTNFKTPDPWKSFYAREGLGVRTWDIYDDVIGAFGGQLERLLAVGGDEEIKRPEGSKANRFEPVVTFMGPYKLKKGKYDKHNFRMPQYIGSVRTMVIAANDGSYGHADKSTPVRQPLMILGTLPRILGPGEKLNLPVDVFCYDENIKNVKVSVKTTDLIQLTQKGENIVPFENTGDKMTYFPIEVKNQPGIARFEIEARSGSNSAKQTINIDIRNPNPSITRVFDRMLENGENWNVMYDPVGMTGTNRAVLEVSSIPPINFDRRLKFLLQYPYGCVEQTTSTVFPQLFLKDLMEVNAELEAMTETNIKSAIKRLRTFQTVDGGFKYWPNQTHADDWSTSYVGHFLLEARNKGYSVNENMLQNWIKYQKRAANRWQKSKYLRDDLIQAYRLYTLVLANETELGAMNRLKEEGLSIQAAWRLAAAYALAGQKKAAEELVNVLTNIIPPYRELSNTYGSNVRDEAMILETLILIDQKVSGMDLLKKLSGYLSDENHWMSTQSTAYCLLAISKFLSKSEISKRIDFDYKVNNGRNIRAVTEMPMIQKEVEISPGKSNEISLKNNSGGIIFTRLIVSGTPLTDPQTETENDLRLNVVYKDMSGKVIDIEHLQQGMDLIVEVSVKNPGLRGDYKELALTQIFPSGFEIINSRMDEIVDKEHYDKPEYQDIRDDRIYSYFDLEAGTTKIFRQFLNASYAGKFYLPAVGCEAMYDASISARKSGKWIEIAQME